MGAVPHACNTTPFCTSILRSGTAVSTTKMGMLPPFNEKFAGLRELAAFGLAARILNEGSMTRCQSASSCCGSLEISSADSFRSLVEADSSPLLFQSTLRTEFDPGVSLLPSLNSDRSFFVFFFFCLLMELSRPFFFFFVCFSSSMMSTEQRSLLSLSLLRPFLLPFFCLDLAVGSLSVVCWALEVTLERLSETTRCSSGAP
mmetsp:Transcript_1411/g.2922  ORF Transcript_1411/g.2922 Transcript_1411/m.2922 type:complete len:202 (+) Transcript_1411:310-915(+)